VDVYPRCRRVAPPFGLPSAGFVAALQSPRAVLGDIWTAMADRLISQTFPSLVVLPLFWVVSVSLGGQRGRFPLLRWDIFCCWSSFRYALQNRLI